INNRNSRFGEKIHIQKNKGKLINFEIPAKSNLNQRFIGPPTEGKIRVSYDRHNVSRQNKFASKFNITAYTSQAI
ncbi:hypothetical protein L9F63_004620, partial [Diploptera punctata]